MCNNNWWEGSSDGRNIQPGISRQMLIDAGIVSGRKSSDGGDGCFIATEIYGDSQANEVNLLRLYRDVVMRNSFIGRRLIDFYYGVSPTLVKLIRKFPITKKVITPILNTIVTCVNEEPSLRNEECDISIQFNTGCNLDCKLCFRKHDTERNNKHIYLQNFWNFIDRYNFEHGIEWIIWEGRGELFVDYMFPFCLNRICERHPNIIHTVITNGTIDALDELKYPEKVYLSISLDGLRDVHEDNRGIGTFNKTVAFIKHALTMGFADVTIRSIATKRFLSQLPQFSDFVKELSSDIHVYVQEVIPPFDKSMDIEYLYTSRDSIEVTCTGFTNIILEKKHHLHKQISLHPEGIFNCNKPTCKIADYHHCIPDVLSAYNLSRLDCKNCKS